MGRPTQLPDGERDFPIAASALRSIPGQKRMFFYGRHGRVLVQDADENPIPVRLIKIAQNCPGIFFVTGQGQMPHNDAAPHLPVIIHDRDAHADTLEILKKYKPKGVVHAFSGSVEMAREITKLGMQDMI